MKTKVFTAILGAAVFLAGCAGLDQREKEDISRRLSDLKSASEEANARLEDLNNKFLLLQEKVESTRAEVEKLSSEPSALPEGLVVVELGEKADGDKAGGVTGTHKAKEPAAIETPHAKAGKPAAKAAPDVLYSRGQNHFMSARYAEARKAFMELFKSYPKDGLADNALYWVGESYYTEKDFDRALSVFMEAVDKYPAENKAPDALFKAGLSYLELNNRDKARAALESVLKRYPDSEAAMKAKKTLAGLSGVKEGSR